MNDTLIKVTDNFEEGARLFDRIARRAGNTVGLMKNCAGIMTDEVEENFAKEGRPSKWRGLKPSTKKRRQKMGHWPGKILQVRGRLAKSFQPAWDNNHAVCGTNVVYARIQHFGGTTKHAARMRVLHFDQVHRGRMTHGRPGTGDRFAKPSKAKYGMRVAGNAYSATIPARPILYISPYGIQRMIEEGKAWLRGA